VSLQKTTVMSSVGKVNTFSDGEDSSTVNNYKFLVVLITNDSYTNEETKIRIRFSRPTMANLTKTLKVLEVPTNTYYRQQSFQRCCMGAEESR